MRTIILISYSFLFIACSNNDESGSILSDPPYISITDSIRQTPQNADLYYHRAILLHQNNQTALAEEDIRKAWNLQPKEEYALSLTTLLKQKNTDSAIVFLKEAVQKLPNSIALQIGLARGYQNKKQPAIALQITDAIIQQYPGQLDALTLKSEILASQNDKKGALTWLEKAYALVPSDPSLAYDLAFEYADAKNAKALTLADSILNAKGPEPEKAWYIKGVYFANSGHSKEAVKNFDEAIRINYNFMDAYRDKGSVLLDQKNYKEALQTFQLALKIAPASAEFYYLSAKAQEGLGNKADAKLNYQRAYGLDRSMTEAKAAADKL